MRKCGILMPIFSLSSKYGIGTLGKEAYAFVDFLTKSGQSYWQILPLNPTSFGDSPYQSFSSFAGNPYFIDIPTLIQEGLLTEDEADSFDFGDDAKRIDYGKLYTNRLTLLFKAFSRFIPDQEYITFCKENEDWLNDYSLFISLKKDNDEKCWNCWDTPLKYRENLALTTAKEKLSQSIDFHKFLQFKFFEQWFKLKAYANKKGIKIIGDLPIYTAFDSADVWSEPEQFKLDEDFNPTVVSGCPPDAFSEDGQLWGNPVYDWSVMKREDYRWWKNRLSHAFKLYDVIRIDHFRGFEAYYTIPFGEENAKNGKWEKGPDIDFFNSLEKTFGSGLPIIAEDLGYLTPEVLLLLKKSGFPGMKVLQFAFSIDEQSNYLPHNIVKNSVVYTGTHDNDTINGWLSTGNKAEIEYAKKYLDIKNDNDFCWTMIKTALMSAADTCILMMPDLIGLGSEGRINSPSTVGENWVWRIKGECINDWLARILRENTEIYHRIPIKKSLEN